jgi:hypothetical protein
MAESKATAPDFSIALTVDMTAAVALRERLVARARQLPGVVDATPTISVPFWMQMSTDLFRETGDSVPHAGDFTLFAGNEGYFHTTGTRVVRGRGFTAEDRDGAPPVMVVSASAARALWPGREAIGECLKVDEASSPCRRVVGVAEDVHRESLDDDPGLQYYVPVAQFRAQRANLWVRTAGDASAMAETIRRALQREMPGSAYVTTKPMPPAAAAPKSAIVQSSAPGSGAPGRTTRSASPGTGRRRVRPSTSTAPATSRSLTRLSVGASGRAGRRARRARRRRSTRSRAPPGRGRCGRSPSRRGRPGASRTRRRR